ncbi:transposase [Lactobacillus sp. M0396]|uniref:transposase n=1 Tax=Lactobacillus sp. M0396 TaxID=2751030 RepID=UPI0018DD0D8C|nr:transposase [Lactobacillus sp. M0396]
MLEISQITTLCLLGGLGDLRRFRNLSALNDFMGIDLHYYESGNLVSASTCLPDCVLLRQTKTIFSSAQL